LAFKREGAWILWRKGKLEVGRRRIRRNCAGHKFLVKHENMSLTTTAQEGINSARSSIFQPPRYLLF
jgi:hypothetical protein